MKSKFARIGIACMIVALMGIACLPLARAAPGQSYSQLSPEEIAYAQAVATGGYAYGIDWTYSYEYGEIEFPTGSGMMAWRPVGSEPADQYADYLVNEMKSIGLKNVAKEAFPAQGFEYGGASVQIVSPGKGDVWLAASHAGLPGTSPAGITADLVYVGLGTKYDYVGKDVSGKLVLIDVSEDEMFWLQYPLMEAEVHGAIGAVVTWVEYQLLPNAVVTHDSESRTTIPALDISKANAAVLKNMIAAGITPKVKIWCDTKTDYKDTGYNVVGYLPSANYGTPADRFVIVADHYDKWWYGASDNGAGVGRLLGIAKALSDSHYMPARTIIFVATSAEEYGWSDTEFDWGLGAWWEIFKIHPEWAGKTLGEFALEGGGTIGATSVSAYGNPDTLEWRKSLLPKFNDFFAKTAPWSKYYYKSSVNTVSFATTWADEFSFCAAGIPIMSIDSTRSSYAGYDYHTNLDTMAGISGESLAMSIISNGIAVIELDRAKVAPYSFQDRASDLKSTLNTRLIAAAGIDIKPILNALSKFGNAGGNVWSLMPASTNSANAAKANDLLLQAAYRVLSDMTTVGGYTTSMYPHQHYLDDSWFFREGIKQLGLGDIDGGLMWLSWAYGMYTGRMVSPEVYQYLVIDRWDNPLRTDLFWATGRLAYVEDFYSVYQSLVDKKAAGITDYSAEIAQLTAHYMSVVGHLQASLDSMVVTLNEATNLLLEASVSMTG
jgi:Iap family predicted aminopeptidase